MIAPATRFSTPTRASSAAIEKPAPWSRAKARVPATMKAAVITLTAPMTRARLAFSVQACTAAKEGTM
ncbi:hypothetical protein AEGHOMDF_6026 [Methylobacterium soli]|nr:hypothetical protein AEGHOMDF_6026 [Methylobacterium soli]